MRHCTKHRQAHALHRQDNVQVPSAYEVPHCSTHAPRSAQNKINVASTHATTHARRGAQKKDAKMNLSRPLGRACPPGCTKRSRKGHRMERSAVQLSLAGFVWPTMFPSNHCQRRSPRQHDSAISKDKVEEKGSQTRLPKYML